MHFHLIQRGEVMTPPLPESPTKLSEFVRLDYMGAAEFEWGALPKSNKEMASHLSEYEVHNSGLRHFDGRMLYILCKPEQKGDVAAFLYKEYSGERNRSLHEPAHIYESLVRSTHYQTKTSFWWDIDNHWMAILGENNMVKLQIYLENRAKGA